MPCKENTVGRIFAIQRFSIHDGPGIRTTVFLKGCPLRCLWCHNPEGINTEYEIAFYPDRCIRCGRCAEICSNEAQLVLKRRKFARDLCDLCGKCVKVCPARALVGCGREISVEDLVKEIEKDRLFYENSGGGVTLSGGEPLMQARFCTQIFKACQEKGIHTALDTSGFAEWQTIRMVTAYVDLILYDLKIIDSIKHKMLTGAPNQVILNNLMKLAHSNVEFILRLPMIPHVNDSYKDLKEMIAFIKKLKEIRAPVSVDLLPYHQFAEPKYEKFGRKYALKGLVPLSSNQIKRIVRLFEKQGISLKLIPSYASVL